MEQIQCCIHFPGKGFAIETVRLISIDFDQWEALHAYVSTIEAPCLQALFIDGIPTMLDRERTLALREECDRLMKNLDESNASSASALMSISGFIDQAADQPDAGVRFVHWPGVYFETQTYLLPDVEIVADLTEINAATTKDTELDMEKLIIKNSRWKIVLVLIVFIVFVVIGIWMIIEGEWFGWVGILLFGSGIPVSIWQIADSRPRYIIDEQGILDPRLGIGHIAWSDIRTAYVWSVAWNDFIGLELKNPEKYVQRLSRVKRALHNLGIAAFSLHLFGVDARTDEVFELIMKNCQVAAQTQSSNSLNSTPE